MNKEALKRLAQIEKYKGYEIDAGMIPGGYTVFFAGDEIYFPTREAAKKFIDEIEAEG